MIVPSCYNDRRNHRSQWRDLICAYNQEDPARLGREIFMHYDIYNGIRSRREFTALQDADLIDVVLWVDASKRLPDSSDVTMELTTEDADHIIDNNGSLAELKLSLAALCATNLIRGS